MTMERNESMEQTRPTSDARADALQARRPVKFILVTGGVVSSLGKGIASTKAKRRLHAGWQRGC
jgi:hypothetical protein